MTSTDEEEFCQFVLLDRNVVILMDRVPSLPPDELVPPLTPVLQQSFDRMLLLWNRAVFPSPEYRWHPAGFFSTAGSQCGGVEFNRSVLDGDTLRAGRLWTEPGATCFLNLDGSVRNPEAKSTYDAWVSRLFRWIRARYIKRDVLFYVGPGAAGFIEKGGTLGNAYPAMDDPENVQRRIS